ncbi:MAG: helix-turn-helix transcriptional regulator [Clostridia bacterium]|nr:helix-turn-helix transcriptional regulator [Clostridia bacterium]
MKNYIYHLKRAYPNYGWSNPLWGDKESDERPLMVNCASCVKTPVQHACRNRVGRLDYCLMYVISGRLCDKSGEREIVLTDGDVIIIPPKTTYCFECTGESIYFLCVHFTGSQSSERIADYKLPVYPIWDKTCASNQIKIKFQKLFEGFSSDDPYRDNDLSALLEMLLIEVARSIDSAKAEKHSISKSLNYIKEFYSKPITVSELAKLENMCPTSYNLCFKQIMGVTPTKYIINLRIDAGKELLEFSDLPISEIASMCGYADFNFFSRAFKKVTGKTPSQYRKSTIN